jgi:isoleucyl-tRNA synthetase
LKKCRNFALSQVEKQTKQFKSLALIADFENRYLTLDHFVEKAEIKIFHKMLNDGLAYQDLKPIY